MADVTMLWFGFRYNAMVQLSGTDATHKLVLVLIAEAWAEESPCHSLAVKELNLSHHVGEILEKPFLFTIYAHYGNPLPYTLYTLCTHYGILI